jgi:DNA-binding transcriptional MerR regulator
LAYTVGEVAKNAKISVRTLHYYDEVGLLRPSQKSESGYRLYTMEDLERLQQILFYKELGFSLDEIGTLIKQIPFKRKEVLLSQKELIHKQVKRLQAMMLLIDKTVASIERGIPMTKEEMFEVFGDFDQSKYQEEAEKRWGDSEAYKESARRTRQYTKDDWKKFKDESERVNKNIVDLMIKGIAPDHPKAMDAVEEYRQLINDWFYPCDHKMHACLGDMYVTDPRFKDTYEKIHPGLAEFLQQAIAANLRRHDSNGN